MKANVRGSEPTTLVGLCSEMARREIEGILDRQFMGQCQKIIQEAKEAADKDKVRLKRLTHFPEENKKARIKQVKKCLD